MGIKFCPECGNPLKLEDRKFCPNCRTPIVTELSSQTEKDIKTKKRKWENFSWILLLIGSAIGIFALFTPTGSFHYGGLYSWDMWMVGYNEAYDWETGWDIFWTMNEDLFVISVGSTIFVVIGNVLALVGAISLINRGIHKSNLAIASPIIAGGATLFYLAGYQVMFFIYTQESFWSLLSPAFGIYGQLLAALVMVVAYFIARSAGKYQLLNEKYKHQENLYSNIKIIVEKGQLQDDQRESLSKLLEIVELRFKGIALLQNRIESLSSKKSRTPYLEPTAFVKALEYFQKALELSSDQHRTILQKNLQFASKIIIEQDRKIAIFYLNQIRNQTDFLLGALLMMFRYRNLPDKYDWKHKISRYETTPAQQSLSSHPKTETIVTDQEENAEIKERERMIKMDKNRKSEQIICNFLMENKGKAFTTDSINNRCLELQQLDLEIDEIESISKYLNSLGKIGREVKENKVFYYIH